MTNVRKYTDKELLNRVMALSTFKKWPIGYFDIWVRSNEDGLNLFDDKAYTFYYNETLEVPIFKMVTSGTTNTGLWGLKNWFKYNSKGVAILKADVIIYNSHIKGHHKGRYGAYVQSYDVGFPYYRDNNSNNKSEEIGQLYNNRIGANCHRAGWFSLLIGKYSLGCLVRNIRKDYNKWMKLLNGQKYLTVVILKEF